MYVYITQHRDGEMELEEAQNLMCKCGHKASLHGFYVNWLAYTAYISQCCACGIKDGSFICGKFELDDKQ